MFCAADLLWLLYSIAVKSGTPEKWPLNVLLRQSRIALGQS